MLKRQFELFSKRSMKIIKGLFLSALFFLFLWVFYLVLEEEEKEVIAVAEPDTIQQIVTHNLEKDDVEIDSLNEHVSTIFDLKVLVENDQIHIFELDELKLKQHLPYEGFQKVLSSDLNADDSPEFWLLFKQNKRVKFLGFSWEKGKLIHLNFPEIKGRQQIGYIGNDSLYLEKGLLVREFKFANDPYAEIANGNRKCFYAFGKDRSFILKKTIDYDK